MEYDILNFDITLKENYNIIKSNDKENYNIPNNMQYFLNDNNIKRFNRFAKKINEKILEGIIEAKNHFINC